MGLDRRRRTTREHRAGRFVTVATLAGLLALAAVNSALAKPSAPSARVRATVFQAVSDCRKVTEDAARLACFDQAVGALDVAEQKGDVVVVDRVQAREVRRQAFGFTIPSINTFFRAGAAKEDAVDNASFQLASTRQGADGRWVLSTSEDQVWRMTDSADLYPEPKAGDALVVKRGAIGSYFCKVGHQQAVRCVRDH